MTAESRRSDPAWSSTLRAYTPGRAVERTVESGGIGVKAFVEPGFGGAYRWPTPRPETLAALREEASRRELVFVVQANGIEAWRAAIACRADVIAHGLWHWPGNLLDATPPAEVREAIAAAARATATLRMMLAENVRLLFGADPLQTVAAYDAIDRVFLNGEAVARRSLLPRK